MKTIRKMKKKMISLWVTLTQSEHVGETEPNQKEFFTTGKAERAYLARTIS